MPSRHISNDIDVIAKRRFGAQNWAIKRYESGRNMFAVTGITGQVGGVVARVLLAAGLDVRGVIRDPVKGKGWADQGCEVAVAEMNDAVALARAFDGAEAVFILPPRISIRHPGFLSRGRQSPH
jgi:uncharacterized protein YbjT (DUF2867 family)